ncbi:DUF421 domain-containing protein [Caproiciproducens galactitolivorans]|uniref:YetF C-terminal domain-containing protein n=1 Tax=Caproiciproducens galactitolivorans TaxID=642589 RepID=A0A4Z0Y1L2_9FIRM|nr:DUF421 domain-containing protein [Caproiciproducens galactitolivorans]QEY34425.1 DUF421 domain-containing protein [Caproiciproducens galactitolivorans]TGJ77799.1 hypothetical protein CAGA_02030 [Caproiciproducens galactitolivorans]
MTISFIRTLLLYIVIIAAVRLMGKRQISELQTSELVVTLLISDIAAIPMQDTGQPLASGFIPIAVLVMCEIVISALMLKSTKFRRLICGRPLIVINDGKVNQKEMRRLRMSTEDLSEQLRQKNVFSIEDVAYAIIETNGKMSVIKKPDKEQPTAGMLGVALPDTGIETVVISDGVISDFSLQLCNKTRDWLDGVLRGKNIKAEDVFIMTANRKGDFNIIKKDDQQ